jgi:hypothetical protein
VRMGLPSHPVARFIERKLTNSRWVKLAKCSQDAAYRDILDLVERGALRKDPSGGCRTGKRSKSGGTAGTAAQNVRCCDDSSSNVRFEIRTRLD